MNVKVAKEILEMMIEDYYALDYPSISQQEAEAIETVLKHINKSVE